jgi:hypothetical protein
MSLAAATPAATAPTATGAGATAAANDAGAMGGLAGFLDLITLLQQDSAPAAVATALPTPAVSAAATSAQTLADAVAAPTAAVDPTAALADTPASSDPAPSTVPAPQLATPVLDTTALTVAVDVVATLPAVLSTVPAKSADAKPSDDGSKDRPAPATPAGDPNQAALAASLIAAAQIQPQPVAAPAPAIAKPQDLLAAPAKPAPMAPQAPANDAKPDVAPAEPGTAAPTPSGPAFDDALARAAAANTSGTPITAPAANGQPGVQDNVKTTAASHTTPAHMNAATDARTLAAAPASGFSVQPVQAAAPATYTAAAVPADAATPAAQPSLDAPAPQTPASVLSQTAVQTLSALSVQISKRLSDGNTKFAVELHPADLGRVDVALTIDRDGKVNAHLNFDTPITAAAFSAHESELRQQLSQAGLNVDNGALTFSSRDGGSGQNPNGQGAFMNQQPQQQPNPHASAAARALAAAGENNDAADLNLSNLTAQGSTLALNLIV